MQQLCIGDGPSPVTRHFSISRICTVTRASPLPLVEMVTVKGLNSQHAILALICFLDTLFAVSKSSMSLRRTRK